MKKCISLVLLVVLMLSCCLVPVSAAYEGVVIPRTIDYSLMSPVAGDELATDESRATGLIIEYALGLTKTGTTLNISAYTTCTSDVIKCGFKNFVVERKKSTGLIWSEYYDFGDLYIDSSMAGYHTTLSAESGYQYRLSCKHYAKKSLLVTQSISNTSNEVTV